MTAIEIGGAELCELGEDFRSEVGDNAFADPVHEIEACGTRKRDDQPDADQRQKVVVDQRGIVGAETLVDHPAHGHRHRQHGECGDDERYDGACKRSLVRQDQRLQRQERAKREGRPSAVTRRRRGALARIFYVFAAHRLLSNAQGKHMRFRPLKPRGPCPRRPPGSRDNGTLLDEGLRAGCDFPALCAAAFSVTPPANSVPLLSEGPGLA